MFRLRGLGRSVFGAGAGQQRPNKSFKPTPLRGANHMADKACHVLHAPTQRSLTLVLGPMYGFPRQLDLSPALGEFTTQLCVGQFDLQFSLGDFRFVVQSKIDLLRSGHLIASWEPGRWPEPAFYSVMNEPVTRIEFVHDRLLEIELESGLVLCIPDASDEYESAQIIVGTHSQHVYIV